MTDFTSTTMTVSAAPEAVYQALTDPGILLQWLPPAPMTGEFHAFDAREGGGYEMSLYYPHEETSYRGKTAEKEDRVRVRFVELLPERRIKDVITFLSDDPAFAGEMHRTTTLRPVGSGTQITMLFEHLPPGLRPEDNAVGAELSLTQLARWFDNR